MKSIIKASLFAAALFSCTQMSAQSYVNLGTASGTNAVPEVQELSSYYQSFSYYNNPEIRRLESEVERHGNLYRWDRWGNESRKYSAVTYHKLSEKEKKDFRNSASNFYRDYTFGNGKSKDEMKDKTLEQQAEEYFNKMIAPFLNSDGSVNKAKLNDEIKKDLITLFELKEAEKQKEVTKLENQLKTLQNTLADRKKNKQEIIEQRMNDLVGLPNTLKW